MAKRFKFRLEVVRRLRKQKEDECRRAVAERLRQVSGVRKRIGTLTDRLHQEHADIRHGASGGDAAIGVLDMDNLRRRHVYVNYLHRSLSDAKELLGRLEAELRREQVRLAEASKELKVINKLEERQRARYELELQRAERAEADEVAAQFARRVGDRSPVSVAEVSQA
jgi:flagellar FliJ protein